MQKSAVCVCLVALKCLKETKYQTNNKDLDQNAMRQQDIKHAG